MKLIPIATLTLTVVFGATVFISGNRTSRTSGDEIERLMQGNEHFRQSLSTGTLEKIEKGQSPHAVVLACSDSRVTPELIFNQGLGDLFVVRTAGNVLGEYELGSIEYAVTQLGTKVIVVLGHDDCGAVRAYHEHKSEHLPGSMQSIVEYIANEEEVHFITAENNASVPQLIRCNILHAVHLLQNDPLFITDVKTGKLDIVGALYHLHDGKVEFLEDSRLLLE
jgi:carbonic anhydrase